MKAFGNSQGQCKSVDNLCSYHEPEPLTGHPWNRVGAPVHEDTNLKYTLELHTADTNLKYTLELHTADTNPQYTLELHTAHLTIHMANYKINTANCTLHACATFRAQVDCFIHVMNFIIYQLIYSDTPLLLVFCLL